MNKEQRQDWVKRGYKDPVAAYREHAAGAGKRGIGFHLTFSEWWSLWEAHYEKRGVRQGQMCMCRTHDAGAYELGNVRIDFNRGNVAEAGMLRRSQSAPATSHLNREVHRPKPPTEGAWMWRRDVFVEYSEEGLDDDA